MKEQLKQIRNGIKQAKERKGSDLAEQFKTAIKKDPHFTKLTRKQQEQAINIIDNECARHEIYGVVAIIKLGERLKKRLDKEVQPENAN